MLTNVALGLLIFAVLMIFYGVIAIHDIPYLIAKKRNHPHQDAIHVAGWVSLFTLHVLWPFLWIWATLYRPERGWGFKQIEAEQARERDEIDRLRVELSAMQSRLAALESRPTQPPSAPQGE
ncbi:DUF3302 domain-containing protein [Halomonas huangheensis]|uniref:GTPase n=1 Tax=Halomonas huangheensis TaxID=1178482 RepID=W1NC61_9GAMM|nr:DUF3302 domain-containing protein [Halomonas huangheensis]ALM52931.1 GTPase [Halomonas huangheensis]ERL53147.1 hypothetical protein BJB45_17885 [Halomonas huangheensis]